VFIFIGVRESPKVDFFSSMEKKKERKYELRNMNQEPRK
jgi:hypothetical protein